MTFAARAFTSISTALCAVALAPGFGLAGEISSTETPPAHELPDLVVTGRRVAHDRFLEPEHITRLSRRSMRERSARSTPDALQEEVGVHVQHTRSGAGSPFIRGLTGNQVLILYDGVRFNNATFRFGPNQYLNTIDPFSLEAVEVVRGPSSVLYGSDAMGGVVNLIPKRASVDPEASAPVSGEITGRYGSATQEKTGHAEIQGAFGGVAARVGYTRRAFDDLDGGRGAGRQSATAYREQGGHARFEWRLGDHQRLDLQLARVVQYDIDRKDALDKGDDLERRFNPQSADLGYLRYTGDAPDAVLAQWRLTTSFNHQISREKRRQASKPAVLRDQKDRVFTPGAQAEALFDFGSWSRVVAGAEWSHDQVDSARVDSDRLTGVETARTGTFPDHSDYFLTAGYLEDTISPREDLDLMLGGRFTRADVNTNLAEHAAQFSRFTDTVRAWTGSAHVSFRAMTWLNLVGGVSQGFRAPNLDDLAVITSSGQGQDVPSPGLKPETSWNYELGAKTRLESDQPWFQGFDAELFGFAGYFRNLIVVAPGTWKGFSVFDDNDNGVIDAGEKTPVRTRRNTGRAFIKGLEASARWNFQDRWRMFGSFASLITRDRVADEPLSRTPPTKGSFGLRYGAPDETWWAEGVSEIVRGATRLSAADLRDFRIPAGGTGGFALAHLRAGARLHEHLNGTIAIENLTNRDYRRHGSSFNGAGTNVVLSLVGEF